jgi:hypothetical protein
VGEAAQKVRLLWGLKSKPEIYGTYHVHKVQNTLQDFKDQDEEEAVQALGISRRP